MDGFEQQTLDVGLTVCRSGWNACLAPSAQNGKLQNMTMPKMETTGRKVGEQSAVVSPM